MPVAQWECEDTIRELRGVAPRVLPVQSRPLGVALTWSDYFCGAGGSSSGIEQIAGSSVIMAVNHWPLAVNTHNHNLPHADHDVANVARTNPRRYPRTDMAWFSPECTFWTVARGDKCDYDRDFEQLSLLDIDDEDDETPEEKEAKWRSRMLMIDVVRFSAHHKYKGVVVENVPDILKWANLDRWLGDMRKEGYKHKIIVLNSAFANALGLPAPQLRDRVYFVFWKARYRTPNWDKWLRPQAWCPSCGDVVRSLYTAKPGPRRAMRYGPRSGQYFYRCPKTACRGRAAQPYVLPAMEAIDWQLDPGRRIGDRKRPLKPKTRARIEAGISRFFRPAAGAPAGGGRAPLLVPTGGTRRHGASPMDRPMPTRTTTENDAVLVPPLIVPLEGRDGIQARLASLPLRAQTTRSETALVVPLRNNGVARPTSDAPTPTIVAGGTHVALVEQPHHGSGYVLYQYDTGHLRPLAEPMPTQTTVEGDALLGPQICVDDCTLRMLAVHEVQAGMAFAPQFELLGKAKRDKVRMLGNAVTPPASRDLAAALTEAITGVELDPLDLVLAA